MKNRINKLILSFIVAVGSSFTATSQSAATNDPIGTIAVTTYIPPQVEQLSNTVASSLRNKLNQIIAANGVSGAGYNTRFILTANIDVVTKDLTATAPPMTALTLNVTLHIGDGYDGKKFASKTITVKGADINETKAYLSALKNIKVDDPSIQAFIKDGKTKIVNYYSGRCSQIMQEAKMLEAQNQFEQAIFVLGAIPQESSDCYNKVMPLIAAMYQKMIDRNCRLRLAEANNIWNAGQTVAAANSAGAILVTIDPQSSCYRDVLALNEKIAKRVLELDKREWNYKMDKEVNLQRDMIKAYRDVGVAWGNGQPNSVTYNVIGWW